MENKALLKSEGLIRALCSVLSCITALVMCLNAQTKTVFFVQNKATPKDIQALWILGMVASVAAAYHLLHLFKCFYFQFVARKPIPSNKLIAWFCFLLDQGVTYVLFSATMAALQGSLIAVTGVGSFQWSKVCNIYTRFCVQVGGSLFCGMAASLAMAVVSSLSAYRLFRLYPSVVVARSASPRRWRCWRALL